MTAKQIIAAGFIATPTEAGPGAPIYGIGATQDAARMDAAGGVGDEMELTLTPATQALLDLVEAEGGLAAFEIVGGVAVTKAEADPEEE